VGGGKEKRCDVLLSVGRDIVVGQRLAVVGCGGLVGSDLLGLVVCVVVGLQV
jgi:hypothetical protein